MSTAAKAFLTDLQAARMERILEATLNLIAEVGADRMTMRDIAAASHVSAATLYNRFETKDNVVSQAVLARFERVVRPVIAHSRRRTPLQNIVDALDVLVDSALKTPKFAHALMGSYFKLDNDRQMAEQLHAAVRGTWQPFLEEMHGAGSLRQWVSLPLLIEEISDRIFAVVMRWSQGGFGDSEFYKRMRYSVVTVLLSASRGKQAEEAESLLISAVPSSVKPKRIPSGKRAQSRTQKSNTA
jgi:AcrR family transcriptional regulator